MDEWRLLKEYQSMESASKTIAMDEALVINSDWNTFDAILVFWSNTPSAVIGNGQQVSNEIDILYAREKDIAIIRRWTGGGTVFHDSGVINVSLIHPKTESTVKWKLSDWFANLGSLLSQSLKICGVNAYFQKPNKILINNNNRIFKIGGGAGRILKNQVLIHYSILVHANLTHLSKVLLAHRNFLALQKRDTKIMSTSSSKPSRRKFVQSQPMNISNLTQIYPKLELTFETIQQAVVNRLQQQRIGLTTSKLTATELTTLEQLVTSKYATSEWNYRY